jgi:hypothetical protein
VPVLRRLFPLLLGCAFAAAVAGCGGCGVEVVPDAGTDDPDAGLSDAGSDAGLADGGAAVSDAGPVFKTGFADVPCPEESFDFEPPDGGFPDGTIVRGLCIGLSRLDGVLAVDNLPPTASVHFMVDDLNHQSGLDVIPEPDGRYALWVMQSRYDRLLIHPGQLGAHAGHKDFGIVDLRKDQTRNLSVKTWLVGGSAFFAGQPWPSTQQPPDLTLHADGLPSQTAFTSNQHGAWHVRLMEGEFTFKLSVPYQSLGETQLLRYPVAPWTSLTSDRTLDIDLPSAELSGNFTLDGQAFPDRIGNGPEFRLQYTQVSGTEPVVTTAHEGGQAAYAALVPRGTYNVHLVINEAADPHLPATVIGKQVATGLDLTADRTLDFDLQTFTLEGALYLDGEPVQPQPGNNWFLYAGARPQPTEPGFLAYYRVPLANAGFSLRALRGHYLLAVLLEGILEPDLAQGWFIFHANLPVEKDLSLPINIPTNVVEGTLLVDGVPASSEHGRVGRLSFRSTSGGRFARDIHTTDGRFRVRLPRDFYEIEFEIDAEAYPDHATGRHPTGVSVDLRQVQDAPKEVTVNYRTLPVGGPFRVGEDVLPDASSAFHEARLRLWRSTGNITYQKRLEGGRPWWFMRVPEGAYQLSFELEPDVLPDVAHGSAGLGNGLKVK